MKAKSTTAMLAALRQKAEERLKKKLPKTASHFSEADMLKIRHELEVHQIELELQQEELMWAKEQSAKVDTEKYAELYNFAPSGYFTLSKAGEILELNLSGSNMLGKERWRLKNSSFGFFVSENTKPIFNLFLGNVFKSKTKETCEVILSTNGNSPMNVYLTGISDKNREQCYVTITDITERKRIENASLESEMKYRQLVAQSPDGIFILDLSGKFISVNKTICDNLKYTEAELLSMKIWEIVPEQYQSLHKQRLMALMSGESQNTAAEYEVKGKDGITHFIEILSVPYYKENKIVGFQGIAHDITKRKQAETVQSNNQALLHTLVQTIPDLIWLKDASGVYLSCNAMFERFIGAKEAGIIGKTDYDFVDQDLADFFREHDFKAMEAGKPTSNEEWVIFADDGHRILLETIKTPMYDSKGTLLGVLGIGRDITERKLGEESLKKQKDEFETIFNLVPAQIWYKDTHNNFIRVNRQACIDIGMTNDKIEGHSAEELFPSFAQQYFKDDLEVFNTHKPKLGIIEQINTSKGEIRWVHSDKIPVFGNDGEVNGLILVVQDITDRKHEQEVLQESEARLNLALQSAYMSVWQWDIIEDKRHFNNQVCYLLGINPETFTGSAEDFFGAVHPDDRLRIKAAIDRTIEKDVLYEVEYRVVWSDKSIHNIAVRGKMSRNDKGAPAKVDGIIWDITERKRAEKQIKLLSKAIEQSPVTVMITDKKGNIEYVNPKFTELTGYTLDEIKGKNPRFLQSGLLTREFYKELWNTLLSGNNWYGEFPNKKKNGVSFWESAFISPIVSSHGDISSFIAVMEDITERKKMVEDLIQARAKAEESDRLKTSFLNNISHEIRTPFNGLLGFLSLIQDNDLATDERDEYISIINKSADRLMNTINDIVEISQIQAGQTKLTISRTNIRSLASELYSRFKTDAESKGLKFYINNDLPINVEYINTDNIKLNSILTNLIGNAIKFTIAGSIVFGIKLKSVGEVGIDCRDKACLVSTSIELEFSVKDTGIGIPENKLQSIFEKFMQADGSNTRLFEGSGLGLSIAKAYVEMLDGNIWVESDPGGKSGEKGSTFYFTIPYCNENGEKKAVKNITMEDGGINQVNPEVLGLKILIAEDNEESAVLLAIAVKLLGKEVIKVRTGFEAVEACRNNPDLDLVLMDIKMPDMDGYEATRQIRTFNNDVVIIAQTAYALTGDHERAIEAGCNDYIAKPFNRATLGALIEKHFKKRQE